MKIRMQLMSDAIFGNGESVPGGEDISILCDENGFPYYKGGTFKGIFREELSNYLGWTGKAADGEVKRLLGEPGDDDVHNGDKLVFSDFRLSEYVMQEILRETGEGQKDLVLSALSHLRTFTAVSPDGIVKEGSLRSCRCVNRGLNFYGEVTCSPKDGKLVEDVLLGIKFVGTMRNRGFGKVKLSLAADKVPC